MASVGTTPAYGPCVHKASTEKNSVDKLIISEHSFCGPFDAKKRSVVDWKGACNGHGLFQLLPATDLDRTSISRIDSHEVGKSNIYSVTPDASVIRNGTAEEMAVSPWAVCTDYRLPLSSSVIVQKRCSDAILYSGPSRFLSSRQSSPLKLYSGVRNVDSIDKNECDTKTSPSPPSRSSTIYSSESNSSDGDAWKKENIPVTNGNKAKSAGANIKRTPSSGDGNKGKDAKKVSYNKKNRGKKNCEKISNHIVVKQQSESLETPSAHDPLQTENNSIQDSFNFEEKVSSKKRFRKAIPFKFIFHGNRKGYIRQYREQYTQHNLSPLLAALPKAQTAAKETQPVPTASVQCSDVRFGACIKPSAIKMSSFQFNMKNTFHTHSPRCGQRPPADQEGFSWQKSEKIASPMDTQTLEKVCRDGNIVKDNTIRSSQLLNSLSRFSSHKDNVFKKKKVSNILTGVDTPISTYFYKSPYLSRSRPSIPSNARGIIYPSAVETPVHVICSDSGATAYHGLGKWNIKSSYWQSISGGTDDGHFEDNEENKKSISTNTSPPGSGHDVDL